MHGVRAGLRLGRLRDYGIVVSFVALFVTLSLASDVFLTWANLTNILDQWAPVGIMACAATLVIIAGGFDLSVGAIFAVAGIIAAKLANTSSPTLAFLAALGVGLALGVGNGLLTTVGRINSFVGTLASSFMIRGFALVLSGGFLITVDDPSFQTLGSGEFLGVTYPVYVFLTFALLTAFLLTYTTFGRYVYAAGANPAAARLSGVRVNSIRVATFALSGLSAALAGIIVVESHLDRAGRCGDRDRVLGDRRGRDRRNEHLRRRGGDLANDPRRSVPRDDRERLQPARHRSHVPADHPGGDHPRRSCCGCLVAPRPT